MSCIFRLVKSNDMKTLLKVFPIFFLFLVNGSDYADEFNYSDEHEEWKLVQEKGNLKVYKRTRAGTSLKELRIDYVFNVSSDKLKKELDHAEGYTEWIYKCSEARVLANPAPDEIIYYTRANVPSPVWDRDIVAHSFYRYDEALKTHYYHSHVPENDEELVPIRKKIIRVKDYGSTWEIKEVGENRIETINTVFMDPAGSIPNWMTNMTLAKGPLKSMEALKERLKK